MKNYTGSCHCQAVTFKVSCNVDKSYRCDCSICKRKGAKMVYAKESDLEVTCSSEHYSHYQFNTHTAAHYFCKTCGIYTFHKTRTLPGMVGINSGCLLNVDTFALPVEIIHGAQR